MALLPPQTHLSGQAGHKFYFSLFPQRASLFRFSPPLTIFFSVPPLPFPPSYPTHTPTPTDFSSPIQYLTLGYMGTASITLMVAPSNHGYLLDLSF